MSAAQLFGAVLSTSPENPFVAIAYTLYQSLYSPMSTFYMRSLSALHGLYAVQTILLLVALGLRVRRNRGDVWLFRMTSTSRGSYITPHFAVAWQVSTLGFLILLQPYLVMTTAHANGDDWPGYLCGRNAGFLVAWLSTWLALWSLAVAVALPRAGSSRHGRFTFFSSPAFLNVHFIAGLILCTTSILIPSVICSNYYDAGIEHFQRAYALLESNAPTSASMSAVEVDAALAEVVPIVQGMLDNLATFPYSFGIAWTLWLVWICYSYGVFVIVAGFYFGSIRRNMKRVAGLDSKLVERVSLQRAWYFATATSIIVTITGLVYGGAALYVTVWTAESLTVKKALEAETLISLYSFAILGLVAAAVSVAQSLVGSSATTNISASASNTHKLGDTNHSHVRVHVQTRTEVDIEKERNVVQLELQDWQGAHHSEEKVRFEDI